MMRRRGFRGRKIFEFIRERELRDTFSRDFQRALHVTTSFVERLDMEEELEGHTGCVNCLEWNQTGSILASASDDVQIILWDPLQRKQLHSYRTGHSGNVFTVKFLPNTSDRVLVTGAGDCSVRVHDITSDETTYHCGCHNSRVKRIATAQSLPHMFWSAAEDGTVMQFDLRKPHSCDGKLENVLINLINHKGREAEVKCIAVNPVREELIAVGANDPFIRLYDRRMIKEFCKMEPPGPQRIYSSFGTSGDNLIRDCVEYYSAGHLPTIQGIYKKNYRNLVCTYLTFAQNGRDLLANMGGEQVYIFDISEKREPKRFQFSDVGLNKTIHSDFNFPNDVLYGSSSDSGIFPPPGPSSPPEEVFVPPEKIEKLKNEANDHYVKDQFTQAICVYNDAISQCKRYAYLYGNRAAAYMKRDWDGDLYAAVRDCHRALKLDQNYAKAHFRLARCLYELQWVNEAFDCLKAFKIKHPNHFDQKSLKALTKDITLAKSYMPGPKEDELQSKHLSNLEKYWRANASDFDTRFCGHCNTTTDIKEANFFGSDGQFVVAGSDDGSFFIWDRHTTNIVKILHGDESIVNCIQPHPLYCMLATSGIDPVVRLWTPKKEDKHPSPTTHTIETVVYSRKHYEFPYFLRKHCFF